MALAAGSLAAFLLLLELVLRGSGVQPGQKLGTRRLVDAHWTRLLDCYPSNPRGYFEIDLRRPEDDAHYRTIAPRRFDGVATLHPWAVLSEYNHLRFRDQPPSPRREGVRRVVVFGDSFTEGQGVKEPDTLPRVLEERLNAAGPRRYEVRNCGRRAHDFPALYDAFEPVVLYDPDLVVYALVLNDAARTPEFQARQTYVNDWILDRERLPEEEPSRRGPLLLELVRERVAAWSIARETTRWYVEMWSEANPGWPRTQEYVRRMDARLRERGSRLLVVVWPLLVGLDSGYPFASAHQAVARFCRESGIAHHDLLPALRSRSSSQLWVHEVDRHPNEIAQRLAAESVAPAVREALASR
jgi:lysophospholipase L1-like esterase